MKTGTVGASMVDDAAAAAAAVAFSLAPAAGKTPDRKAPELAMARSSADELEKVFQLLKATPGVPTTPYARPSAPAGVRQGGPPLPLASRPPPHST